MNNLKIVYESPNRWDYLFIKKYLKEKVPVFVVEPFHAYHHNKGIRFFPPHLPPYVENLIINGKISVLKAKDINAEKIYFQAADKAVEVVESVFPEYRRRYEKIFSYVSETLKSPIAENAFRNNLCNRLAEFYSANILLHRIENCLNPGSIMVYPDTNVYSYFFIKGLLSKSNQEFFEHPNIRFPIKVYVNSFLENLKQNLISTTKLCAQTLASGLLERHHYAAANKKKVFSYGVTILSPRQLKETKRGPDFIIDNKKILASEVIYFPLMTLTKDQQKTLAKLPGEVHQLPKAGRFFSNYPQWKRLLYLGVKQKFLRNGEELMAASNVFFNYFRWRKVMEDVSIRHFITHCDFGTGHIGRGLALNQASVQTWYFTDSMNHIVNFRDGNKGGMHHPFWAYLYYDHLVTWDATLARYYKEHPGSFKKTHVVGCLWGEHIQDKNHARKQISVPTSKNLDNRYVLSCFDSTYSRNGFTSYAEGLAFAKHLLQLADEYPDVYIILKEKKNRSIHYTLDPVLGPKLLEIYNKMDFHPRIKICSNDVDASELISVSDMVISFPFTSTTFEALSANKPAIWHDPAGYYRNTLYGKTGGVVTHSYDELKIKILELKNLNPGAYQNPMPMNSPLMDPYRDGKAIDRFRELLTSE
ncbi:MAG: polysaccharide biosynthesis PFTS motif protein [Desulfobacteraceae bacterium]|nr:polysaccharide biosynthesis PFTS motif protein [Desulfobacteraceae bacterium]